MIAAPRLLMRARHLVPREGERGAGATRRSGGVGRRLVIAGCIGIVAASLVDAGGPIAAFQSAAPVIGAALLLGAVPSLMRRRWDVGTALLLTGVCLLAPMGRTYLGPVTENPGPGRFTVLSFNSYVGRSSAEALIDVVDRVDPDVLVLIEATPEHWNALQRAGLSSRLRHVTGRLGPGGLVVVSREHHTCQELPAGVECGTLVHRSPHTLSRADGSRLDFDTATVRLSNGVDLKAVHAWSIRLRPYERWRRDQETLLAWKDARVEGRDSRPVVMAGDFNAGFSHPVFRRLAAGMQAAPVRRIPWPRTWSPHPRIPMLVQVDHVLSSHLELLDSGVETIPGGDHAAVWATYAQPRIAPDDSGSER